MEHYKLMVIGGGTSGLRTAIAASKKTKTVLIEPGVLGGTCLNTGCIPTKAMLHASHLYRSTQEMDYFGIDAKAKINFKKLMERVNSIPQEGREHIYAGLKKNDNLDLVEAPARFLDKHTVQAGGRKISADNIIICTGARNFVPPIKGIEDVDYLDNENILDLKKMPKSIVMVGGGYIAMEYATFFSDLGVNVTVLERLPSILHLLDEDVRQVLEEMYVKRGIKILTNINIMEVRQAKQVSVHYNDVRDENSEKQILRADRMVLAAGRIPNTEGLDLEKAGVKTQRGIIVDDMMRTSTKHIYALGDVTGKAMFAHACKRESGIVIDNIFNNAKRKMPWDLVPWTVFTHPPVAGIGLGEKSAKEKGMAYEVSKAPFVKNGRAKIIDGQEGFVKVIYDRKILGVTIIGPNADDIIHEYVALMNMGASVDDVRRIIHVHPTLAEVSEHI